MGWIHPLCGPMSNGGFPRADHLICMVGHVDGTKRFRWLPTLAPTWYGGGMPGLESGGHLVLEIGYSKNA